MVVAYLLGGLPDVRVCAGDILYLKLASLVFGQDRIDAALERVMQPLYTLGYSRNERRKMQRTLSNVLLLNRSPVLEAITEDHLHWVHETSAPAEKHMVAKLSRALAALGVLNISIAPSTARSLPLLAGTAGVLAQEWVDWCQEWLSLTTLETRTLRDYYGRLCKIGRWLAQTHPEITAPAQWTATLATECVAMVTNLRIGQYCVEHYRFSKRPEHNDGKPIMPRTIEGYLLALRCFFNDLQESEKIPRRFNPERYFAVPRSVRRKIGPNPRVIDRPLWAKLVWAGQHLEPQDLPSPLYPLEMVRAIAAVWLFTALRSDEIRRLRTGCIEWPMTDILDEETGTRVTREQVCYLHVPTNKTSPAFKKPVAPYVGKVIEAWEQIRPPHEPMLDRKSAEMVSFLFSMRGHLLGSSYINDCLIPLLGRKANITIEDQRGRVTSHRARATIATFLGNCEHPMSLWQLMQWLGHRSEESTRSYVQVDITKMAVKIAAGSFLQQNLASIPVLIDNEAVTSGAAAHGEPWKYYDLGHGFCLLPEWATCRHRMACAKCDFYEPKQSTRMQLLEANGNLTRMLEFVSLGEEERKLVEQGIGLNHALLERLADEPTPAGPTPRQLRVRKGKNLPILTNTVGLVQQESDLSPGGEVGDGTT